MGPGLLVDHISGTTDLFVIQTIFVWCMCGIYDLAVVKLFLGLFGALVSKWPITRKRLAVKLNVN